MSPVCLTDFNWQASYLSLKQQTLNRELKGFLYSFQETILDFSISLGLPNIKSTPKWFWIDLLLGYDTVLLLGSLWHPNYKMGFLRVKKNTKWRMDHPEGIACPIPYIFCSTLMVSVFFSNAAWSLIYLKHFLVGVN